ncbi:MAG: amphi-Trp domain-containing protein [Gammaproteobacteria bacterium]|nr:amphi-Trp domain-containing protein [Gammaproteobacteria bacterium]
MSKKKRLRRFTHESIQDQHSITAILDALSRGMEQGKLSFSEKGGKLTLRPEGLLTIKASGEDEEAFQRIKIQIRWFKKGKRSKQQKRLKLSL